MGQACVKNKTRAPKLNKISPGLIGNREQYRTEQNKTKRKQKRELAIGKANRNQKRNDDTIRNQRSERTRERNDKRKSNDSKRAATNNKL